MNEWINEWFILHYNIQYTLSMSVWKIKQWCTAAKVAVTAYRVGHLTFDYYIKD